MRAGLYETLLGRFADGTPLREVSREEHRLRSVTDNLTRLFNSRQGTVPHLPDYGLPDLDLIELDQVQGAATLAREVESAVRRYEPRLVHVHVRIDDTDRPDARYVFRLHAEFVDGGMVEFETAFAGGRPAHVAPAARH